MAFCPSLPLFCLKLLDFDSKLYLISLHPCLLLITLLVLCENSLKSLLRKGVLTRDPSSQRNRDTKKGDQIKQGDQTHLRTVSVNNILGDSVMYRLLLSRVSLVQVSTSFHMWKLMFQEGVHSLLLNHLCTKSSTYEELRCGLNV